MFEVMNRIACIVLLLPILPAPAQEERRDQQINQAVFNKIEYHFNLQETDSIYALAGPRRKSDNWKVMFRASSGFLPMSAMMELRLLNRKWG